MSKVVYVEYSHLFNIHISSRVRDRLRRAVVARLIPYVASTLFLVCLVTCYALVLGEIPLPVAEQSAQQAD